MMHYVIAFALLETLGKLRNNYSSHLPGCTHCRWPAGRLFDENTHMCTLGDEVATAFDEIEQHINRNLQPN
jgi:hypothetical protein